MSKFRKILALVSAVVMSLTMVAFSASAFSDVAGSVTGNSSAIEPLNALGVFKGYEDGTFKPDGTLSREQFAAIAYRLLTGDVSTAVLKAPTKFPDVKADRWSSGYVAFATEANPEVIKGYTNGTFMPLNKLTVAEMGTMLVRVLGYEVITLSEGASRAFKLGIINSAVVSTTPATRGMAADAVYAAMNTYYLRDMLDGEKVADQPTLGLAIFKMKVEEGALVTGFTKNDTKYDFNLLLNDGVTTVTVTAENDNPVSIVGTMVNVSYTAKSINDSINSNSKIISITKSEENVEVSAPFSAFDANNGLQGTIQTIKNTFKVNDKTFKYNTVKDTLESASPVVLYVGDQLIPNVTASDLENIIMGSKADGTLTVVDNNSDGVVDSFKVADITFLANIKSMSSLTKDVTMNKVEGLDLIGNDVTLNEFNAQFNNILGNFTATATQVLATTGDNKKVDLGTITEANIKAAKEGLDVLVRLGSDGIYHVSAPTTVVGKVTALVINNGKTVQLDSKDYPMLNETYLNNYSGVGTSGAFWATADNKGAEFTATLNANGSVIKLVEGTTNSTVDQGNYGVITAVDATPVNISASTEIGSADYSIRIEVLNAAGVKKVYNTTLASQTDALYAELTAAKDSYSVINLGYEDLMNSKDKFDVSELQNAVNAANPYDVANNDKGIENATAIALVGNYKYTPATLKLTNIDTPISSVTFTLKDGLTSIFYVVKSKDADDEIVYSVSTKTPSTLAAFKEEVDKTDIIRVSTIKVDNKDYVEQMIVYVDTTTEGTTADYRLGFFSEASIVTENGKNITVYKMNELNDVGEKVLVTYKATSTAKLPTVNVSQTEDFLKNLMMYSVNTNGEISAFIPAQFDGNLFTGFAANGDDVANSSYNLNIVPVDNAWTNASSTNSYIKLNGEIVRVASDAKMFTISMSYDSANQIKYVGDMTKVTDITSVINSNNDEGVYANAIVSYKAITGDVNANYEVTAIYFVEDIAFGK